MEMPEIKILPAYSQKMGNLDPHHLPSGLVPLAVSVLLVLFWRTRRWIKWIALVYTLLTSGYGKGRFLSMG
jgi:hypothetical protein